MPSSIHQLFPLTLGGNVIDDNCVNRNVEVEQGYYWELQTAHLWSAGRDQAYLQSTHGAQCAEVEVEAEDWRLPPASAGSAQSPHDSSILNITTSLYNNTTAPYCHHTFCFTVFSSNLQFSVENTLRDISSRARHHHSSNDVP